MTRHRRVVILLLATVVMSAGCSEESRTPVAGSTTTSTPAGVDDLTASLRIRYSLSEVQASCASRYLVSALDTEVVAALVREGFEGLPLAMRFYVSENILPCFLWADPERRPSA